MKADKPATKEVKKPIPTDISGLAYITKTGGIRYARSGKDLDKPKDFKSWVQAAEVKA